MITENDAAKFWVISDTHLIADSLHDNGQAFSQMQKTSQGKDLYYQEVVLSAFVKKALDKKPDAIIVTGDVTFNGERVSAQRFAEIFKPLKGKTKLLIQATMISMMAGHANFAVKSSIMLVKFRHYFGKIFLENHIKAR